MTQSTFVNLLNHPDYEILNKYPFTIRRKDIHHELNEFVSNGYLRVKLNGKKYLKHRLIAEQFLPNPYDYPEVIHINNDKTDNHLDNLCWTSHSKNLLKSSSYRGVMARYVDEIDPEAMVVDYYETKTERHYFTDYYYHDGVFYYDTDVNYRILNVNSTKCGAYYVNMRSTEGKQVKVVIARFLDQHDMA